MRRNFFEYERDQDRAFDYSTTETIEQEQEEQKPCRKPITNISDWKLTNQSKSA